MTTAESLARIESTTAHQLITAVRYHTSPLGPTFIPSLDAYLSDPGSNDAAQPVVAMAGGLASSLNRGDMIEIQGPSGSGKTQVSLFLVMTAVLPSSIKFRTSSPHEDSGTQELEVGGKAQRVVLVHPSTHTSPIRRLAQLIKTHLEACFLSLGITLASRDMIIRQTIVRSLKRLTVYKLPPCTTSFTISKDSPHAPLVATLEAIHSQAGDQAQELSLLLIDGIGDTFWPFRAHSCSSSGRSRTNGGIRDASDVGMGNLVRSLDRIRRDVGCCVVVTNQAIWRPSGEAAAEISPFWAHHLPAPFPAPFNPPTRNQNDNASPGKEGQSGTTYWPLTTHITLLPASSAIRQIRPDVLLYDVLKPDGEGEKRERARRGARGRGLVRVVGRAGVGEFGFAVGEGEVESW